jgi:hypothetical protein
LPSNTIAPKLVAVSPTMALRNEPKLLSKPAAESPRPFDQIRPNQTTFFAEPQSINNFRPFGHFRPCFSPATRARTYIVSDFPGSTTDSVVPVGDSPTERCASNKFTHSVAVHACRQ